MNLSLMEDPPWTWLRLVRVFNASCEGMDLAPNVTDIMIGSVHTWMEPEADKLIMENISKNLSDQVRKASFLGAE